MNPTTDVLEKRIAAAGRRRRGAGGCQRPVGHHAGASEHRPGGDEIVSADNLYGGTYNLFHYTFPRLGINVKFVESNDLERDLEGDHAEDQGRLRRVDRQSEARRRRPGRARTGRPRERRSVYLWTTPVRRICCGRLIYGVDIVVYSATKFIGGHGTSIGGLIVDSGKFDWTNGKFPLIADPDPSYHGLNFVEALEAAGQHRLHHQGAGDAPARPRAGAVARSTPSSSCRDWRRCT